MDKQSNITKYIIQYPINEIIILLITLAISVVYSISVNKKNNQTTASFASYAIPMFTVILFILFYGIVPRLSSNGVYTMKIELLRILITLGIPALILAIIMTILYTKPVSDPRHNVYKIPYSIFMGIGWTMVVTLTIALLVAAIYPTIYIQNIQWIIVILFNILISSIIISSALLSSEP